MSAGKSVRNAHAIVVLTEWNEFKPYDFSCTATWRSPFSSSMGEAFGTGQRLTRLNGSVFYAVGSVNAVTTLGGQGDGAKISDLLVWTSTVAFLRPKLGFVCNALKDFEIAVMMPCVLGAWR